MPDAATEADTSTAAKSSPPLTRAALLAPARHGQSAAAPDSMRGTLLMWIDSQQQKDGAGRRQPHQSNPYQESTAHGHDVPNSFSASSCRSRPK